MVQARQVSGANKRTPFARRHCEFGRWNFVTFCWPRDSPQATYLTLCPKGGGGERRRRPEKRRTNLAGQVTGARSQWPAGAGRTPASSKQVAGQDSELISSHPVQRNLFGGHLRTAGQAELQPTGPDRVGLTHLVQFDSPERSPGAAAGPVGGPPGLGDDDELVADCELKRLGILRWNLLAWAGFDRVFLSSGFQRELNSGGVELRELQFQFQFRLQFDIIK